MNSSKTGLVRRLQTPGQRHRLLARFHPGQLTQRDFAARHRIGLAPLGKWLRGEGQAPLRPVTFQELVLPNPPPGSAVAVVSPRGWIVRLQNRSEVQNWRELLSASPC